MLDFSGYNKFIYYLDVDKKGVVVGGMLGVGLCESKLRASSLITHLYVTEENFKKVSAFEDTGPYPIVLTKEESKITITAPSGLVIHVYKELPKYWVNYHDVKVCDPAFLRDWLKRKGGRDSLIDRVQDTPEELRLKSLDFTEEEKEFEKKCKAFDWYYSFSDSGEVYKRGKAGQDNLIKERDRIGGNAPQIYQLYSNY